MNDFFTDTWMKILDFAASFDITGIFAPLLTDYRLETGGAVFFLLLLLLLAGIRKRRKKRRMAPGGSPPADASGETTVLNVEEEKPGDETEEPVLEPGVSEPEGLVGRLKTGLAKTRRSLAGRIENILSEKGIAAPETMEEIEEALITSDVGVDTTRSLIRQIEENASSFSGADELRAFLKSRMRALLVPAAKPDNPAKPYVIMVVGVNGVGKTTTIGKLAYRLRSENKRVLIGAADTFRAAAVEQLEIWAERSGADIVRHRDNADPAAVAFDAIEAGVSRGSDVVIIDTAGRLQTKVNLMEQLKKIKRSIDKKIPGAPHEVMLVLDATTGQNAISQAKTFDAGVGVDSLVMTKLDGTAKGGIVIGICSAMGLPLQFIGVGEGIGDLQPFDPDQFIDAIF